MSYCSGVLVSLCLFSFTHLSSILPFTFITFVIIAARATTSSTATSRDSASRPVPILHCHLRPVLSRLFRLNCGCTSPASQHFFRSAPTRRVSRDPPRGSRTMHEVTTAGCLCIDPARLPFWIGGPATSVVRASVWSPSSPAHYTSVPSPQEPVSLPICVGVGLRGVDHLLHWSGVLAYLRRRGSS